jgi:type I restriction enzyme S subunit
MSGSAFPYVPFLQAVSDCTGGNTKVQRKDYAEEGELPVIDQGQEFIAGFTGKANKYQGVLPLVLFGDHTRIFKYVDFPFALGADGVKALQPESGFDARFLFYYFRFVELPNAGYSRHFKFLKEIQVPKPPLSEQRPLICFPVPRASFACAGRPKRNPPNSSRRCFSTCSVTRRRIRRGGQW